MAKIGFTKLKLNAHYDDTKILPWGDEVVSIKVYLPMKEKLDLITRIVNATLDNNDFCNDCLFVMNFVIEMVAAYTNINFTEKQREDYYKLYDQLVNSGFWDAFHHILTESTPSEDLSFVHTMAKATIDQVYKYRCSAAGILSELTGQQVKQEGDITALAETLKEQLGGTEDSLSFLHEIMQNFGNLPDEAVDSAESTDKPQG